MNEKKHSLKSVSTYDMTLNFKKSQNVVRNEIEPFETRNLQKQLDVSITYAAKCTIANK